MDIVFFKHVQCTHMIRHTWNHVYILMIKDATVHRDMFREVSPMKISSTHRGTGSDWYEGWKGVRYHDAPKTKTRVSTFISFGQLNTCIKHIVKLLVEPSTLKEMIMVRFVYNIMFSRWCWCSGWTGGPSLISRPWVTAFPFPVRSIRVEITYVPISLVAQIKRPRELYICQRKGGLHEGMLRSMTAFSLSRP